MTRSQLASVKLRTELRRLGVVLTLLCAATCQSTTVSDEAQRPDPAIKLRFIITQILTGEQLAGVKVCFLIPKDTIACAVTDEAGVAETLWPSPTPGNILITIEKDGFLTDAWTGHYDAEVRQRWQNEKLSADAFVEFQYTIPPVALVNVAMGQIDSTLDDTKGHLFFVVVDAMGEGLAGVSAALINAQGQNAATLYYPTAVGSFDPKRTVTTAVGAMTAFNIEATDVTLKVSAPGLTCTPLSTYVSGEPDVVTVPVLVGAMTKGTFICQ